ncbi:MAG: phosphonate C-P lyase system protein PhnH [Acetobacteraceae bacterium]|nr:phosphonate C-P lyase system protein PhnH [Acetobacteraceae bacterium]
MDLPGFADPARDAQRAFRAVLAAMAEPGSLRMAGDDLIAPAPLAPATAAVLLTLVDGDMSLAMDAATYPAHPWVIFHCGTTLTEPAKARFIVALDCPDLSTLPSGSDEAPEESSTLILQVRALGSGTPYCLSGPGLRSPMILRADGLPADFAAHWAANHALFPRGIDIILCAGATLVALPRSMTVENA